MKLARILLGAIIAGLSLAVNAQTVRDDTWQMVWHDEFDGSGAFDSGKWQSEEGFVRNQEPQWYQVKNTYRQDGLLVLEARLDSIPNPKYREGSKDWRRNRPYAKYSSGSVNTRGRYSFLYGQLEVRARIPVVRGAWPAIWTLGTHMPWPSNGEVDVMEFYQVDGVSSILANAAWGNDQQNQAVWNTTHTPIAHFIDKDPDWAEKFHTWVMDWTEDYIRIYLDGELLNDVDLSKTVNGKVGNHENPFHKPQYILLDNAVDIRVVPNPDIFPMRYEVDYVRVYQKKTK